MNDFGVAGARGLETRAGSDEPGPIRVARVITRLNVGGPAQHVAHLAAGLRSSGFETTLFTGALGVGEADMSDLARDRGVEPVVVPGLGRGAGPLGDLRALKALVRRFRRERPAIVHTHTAKAGALGRVAARLAGVPIVCHTFHGHVFEGYFGPLLSRAVAAAERALARTTTAIVAISPAVAGDLCDVFRIAPSSKVRTIELGIDLAPLAPEALPRGRLRAELGIADDVPLIATIGRLVPVKDHPTLLRAFAAIRAQLPTARLVVAGGGSAASSLGQLAENLSIAPAVHLLGDRRDVPSILGDTDLFAISSRNEGTPVALIEALAAGVPAVATRVGGVPDVLREGDAGRLVPPGDPDALASAALALLASPTARHAARAGAAAVRSRFAVERLCVETAALYRELLAAARRPSRPFR